MIPQPLTFYTDANDVNYLKPLCQDECVYKLNSPNDTLLPFIIKRVSSPLPVTVFKVQCFDGTGIVVLDATKVVIAHTNIIDGISYDYLVYDGQSLGVTIDCGQHQAVVSDGTDTWYSEIFTIGDWSASNSPFVRVDYSSTCPIEGVPYDSIPAFNFYFFLNDGVNYGLPTVTQDIQSEQDNFGREITIAQKFSTVWLLQSGSIPMYLVDAWVFCLLHDTITLTGENNGNVVTIENVELNHIPDDNGCTNEVDLNFKIKPDLVQGSCCDEDLECSCLEITAENQIIDFVLAIDQTAIETAVPTLGDSYSIQIAGIGCPSVTWCDHLGERATWNGTGWDYTAPTAGDILYDNTTASFWVYGASWKQVPLITSAVSTGVDTWNIRGQIALCYFARLDFSYDNGASWTEVGAYLTYEEFQNPLGTDVSSKLGTATDIRVVMYNYNCSEIIGNSVVLP